MPRVRHDEGTRSLFRHSGIVLLAGFGGLLLLMAYAGWTTMRALGRTQDRSARIQQDFVERSRLLNQIRSDLYLSGTYVRDYLLEPDLQKAITYRTDLNRTRAEMNSAIESYARLPGMRLAGVNEAEPLNSLRSQLDSYWRVLEPAMGWVQEERHNRGYSFLRDEVFPRRAAILRLADNIGSLNEDQLNQSSERVRALFSQVRTALTVTLLATLFAGTLLAGWSIVRILQVERQASIRYDETAQARRELKDLSARLVDVQETERRAISRELHDEVGQSMSALLVGLDNLLATTPEPAREAVAPRIKALREITESTVRCVRNLSLLLRPSMLDDLGLVPALQWQARETARRTGMRVDVAADETTDELPDEHKTCIYRVVQEGLHNAARHANANVVRIHVRREDDRLLLTIHDDGRGFSTAERGMGLLGIEERVANLDGTFKMESQVGSGTLLAVSLPLPKTAA